MRFVEDALRKYENIMDVVFIMTIDPSRVSASTTPFALIDSYSAFPREQEILFSMHTVFRVHEIKQTLHNIRRWEVHLTLTNDNDPQLAALTKPMREKTQGLTGWHRMGKLMLTVSHFNPAEQLYNQLLKDTSGKSDKANLHQHLGIAKAGQGQYREAISFYEKGLKIFEKDLPPNHPNLATSYNNIGSAYYTIGDYSKALKFY
ncbi:unnamed protein product, partial [Rotaria sp. Silwood2]